MQPKSVFESSGPSSGSTYSSDGSTRRSSSAPTATFPLPPAVIEEDLVLVPRRSLPGPKDLVPDDVSTEAMSRKSTSRAVTSTSPRDGPTGRSWQEINQVYVFPAPSVRAEAPAETTAYGTAAPLASAPPQIETFAFEPLPISPEALAFAPSGHRMTRADRAGVMYSVPSSPALLQDFDHQSTGSEAAGSPFPQRLRSKGSIQQRLRSIFSGPSLRQDAPAPLTQLGDLVRHTDEEIATARQHRRKVSVNARWSIGEPEEATTERKASSPASSRRSSLLKRSDAYNSFERARAGKPPVSPALQSFATLLEQGASAPSARSYKLSNLPPSQQPTFEVYEDSAADSEAPETPRASASKTKPLGSKDLVNTVDGDGTKGWRLFRKASSHVVGRVRGVRQLGLSRPASAAISNSTEATIRPTSEVPTVVIQAGTPARAQPTATSAYPWQSSSTDLAGEGANKPSRWRRASLSIQVPAIPPSETRISPSTSPAFDLSAPLTATHTGGSASAPNLAKAPPSPELLARSLELAQLENDHLRRTLDRQEKELGLLRAREATLADCLETGGKMVRELSEERDELQERLRRISWYSTGGDPAWLSPKPPSTRSNSATSGSSLETKWLGGSRKSRFEDEASS